MENLIAISTLNDFLFCPKSIYYHHLYQKYTDVVYKDNPQQQGDYAHHTIDTKQYSTSKNILQGIDIYSETYGLSGKIDLFHIDKKSLLERKKHIKKIHQGYVLQVYAQYYCLIEMGYEVQSLKLYSMDDNQVYSIPLPTSQDTKDFENMIQEYKKFLNDNSKFTQNPKKCAQCIYRELCDYYLHAHTL